MTTNSFLEELARQLQIPNFRGVFMKDTLPESPLEKECGIMNFDPVEKPGSHWVCWVIDPNRKHKNYYFDSYGTAVPDELRKYLNGAKIYRSDFMLQGISSDICGELCMTVLYAMTRTRKSYKEMILNLKK